MNGDSSAVAGARRFVVRGMRREEARQIAALQQQHVRGTLMERLPLPAVSDFLLQLNDWGDGLVLVASGDDGQIVGFAAGMLAPEAVVVGPYARAVRSALRAARLPGSAGTPCAELLSIWVDPSWRGCGVACALLSQMLETMSGCSVGAVRARVDGALDAANRFLCKQSFRRIEQGGGGRGANIYARATRLAPPPIERLEPLCGDPDRIEAAWWIPPVPAAAAANWRLYSESFVLESLQGCLNEPERVRRTLGWVALARVVQPAMWLAQLVLMLLSVIPVVSSLMYCVAFSLPRGALGFFVRGCYWKTRLRRLGIDTLIDQAVEFTRPERIRVGDRTHIDRGALLAVAGRGGSIRIGSYSNIGAGSHIAGRGGVWIGSFVGLSPLVHVYSVTNQPFDPQRPGELITMSHMAPVGQQSGCESPVRIEDYAVVGYSVLVLPGVVIGRGAIVHAFAEVRQSVAKFGIAHGHGAAVRKGWRRPAALHPLRAGAPGGAAGVDTQSGAQT